MNHADFLFTYDCGPQYNGLDQIAEMLIQLQEETLLFINDDTKSSLPAPTVLGETQTRSHG
jgi:hypothetical protein